MIELIEFALSGHCHKVRLALSLLNIPYRSRQLNGALGEHKTAEILSLNPFGQLPILIDGELVLRDSHSILVYLARTYGPDQWLPTSDAVELANVMAWLAVSANEITHGPNALRLHHKYGRVIALEQATRITDNLLRVLNDHLATADWLANNTLTIADISVYPYIALANEGRVDVSAYPHVDNWLARVEALPNYLAMPGIQHHRQPEPTEVL